MKPLRLARKDQFSGRIWTVEGEAIKGRKGQEKDFRIPVTGEMQKLVDWPLAETSTGYIFPSPQSGKSQTTAVSDQAIENVMRSREIEWNWQEPYRPHGLRATFRSWVSEIDPSLYAVAETALAHRVGGIVERTYARNDFLEQRRSLMERWADHLKGGTGEVIRLADGA